MEIVDIGAMFVLGLVGTVHCIGMCGPLVIALSGASHGVWSQVAYHGGRVVSYGIVGALVSAFGVVLQAAAASAGDDPLESMGRVQAVATLVAALVLFGLGLVRLGALREPKILSAAMPTKVPGLRALWKKLAGRPGPAPLFGIGLLMGLLPCGLSYAAFARALPVSNPLFGGALVLAFGLGTVPGLLLLGTGGAVLAKKHRKKADIVAGVLLLIMAVLMGADAIQAMIAEPEPGGCCH